MAQAPFNKKAVDPATAKRLGEELHAEIKKTTPDLQRIRELVADGADMELRDNKNNTVLLAAALGGREDAAILLVDLGAVPDAEGTGGVTSLILASFGGSQGYLQLAKKLLDQNIDPDKTSFNGKTALMWAANRGFRDIALAIADHGGDILLKSTGGIQQLNSIEWAEDNNKRGMADDLRKFLKRKENEAAAKLAQEQEAAARLAAQIKQQELRVAIADVIQNHGEVAAPEKASFKKRERAPRPQQNDPV